MHKLIFLLFLSIYFICFYKIQSKYKNLIKSKIFNLLYITNYNRNLIVIKKLKKVIYSALFGQYDKLSPIKKQEGFDYFLFTDHEIKEKTNWTILPIPDIVKNLNISIFKKQRFLKLHPHLFFC